ncbi:MAG: hypothetical protein GEU98_08085 [Pseudonocardiaceae bacterium]|nr:hypothetical protein [Pseudonocardiaceae bacterium]
MPDGVPRDGFHVFSDEMRSHSVKVRDVGGRLGTAQSAAGKTTLNNEAFGVIGQFLVPAVLAVETAATAAIAAAKGSTELVSDAVTDAADAYDEAEVANTNPFTGDI